MRRQSLRRGWVERVSVASGWKLAGRVTTGWAAAGLFACGELVSLDHRAPATSTRNAADAAPEAAAAEPRDGGLAPLRPIIPPAPLVASDFDAAPLPPPSAVTRCTYRTLSPLTQVPAEVMLLVETSTASDPTHWADLRAELRLLARTTLLPPWALVGLTFFGSECSPTRYMVPAVSIGPTVPRTSVFDAAIDAMPSEDPLSDVPALHAALEGTHRGLATQPALYGLPERRMVLVVGSTTPYVACSGSGSESSLCQRALDGPPDSGAHETGAQDAASGASADGSVDASFADATVGDASPAPSPTPTWPPPYDASCLPELVRHFLGQSPSTATAAVAAAPSFRQSALLIAQGDVSLPVDVPLSSFGSLTAAVLRAAATRCAFLAPELGGASIDDLQLAALSSNGIDGPPRSVLPRVRDADACGALAGWYVLPSPGAAVPSLIAGCPALCTEWMNATLNQTGLALSPEVYECTELLPLD